MRLSYRELQHISTLRERFEYLRLGGLVGESTFGSHRYLNQGFYTSSEWRKIRNEVIVRDQGCEMGLYPYEIVGRVYIHHINPITIDDLLNATDELMSLDNLVCVSYDMHQAIHYGDYEILGRYELEERRANDTCPWKKLGGIVNG